MKNTKFNDILKFVLLSPLIFLSCSLQASEFSPPGLYEVEQLTLENGIDVILKPRREAHTVSVRVWVGVGTQDFPCELQETPHFLEHLLFTGTSKHTESELDHLVADHGGSWNAGTGVEETIYEMDIYSRYTDFAINTLHEIITDSSITDKNVEISRDIIHRESGGKPSKIMQWFRLQGFGVNAIEKAARQLLPVDNYICDGLITAEGITRDDIVNTFNKYYVPENMAIIVVGDFDRQAIIEQIQRTFGSIIKTSMPERNEPMADKPTSYESVTGTFSPLLSDDTLIGVLYRVPGYWSDDFYPLAVIEEYLNFKINEAIRIERGLAYAPGIQYISASQFGLFHVYADVNLDDIDEALSLIKNEMRNLTDQPMNIELLEKSKLKILLQSVQGYESNAGIADYYASQYVLFRKNRFFENDENKFEAITLDDISRVVELYFPEDKLVEIVNTPTLTYTQFYILLSLFSIALLLAIIYFYIQNRSKKQRRW